MYFFTVSIFLNKWGDSTPPPLATPMIFTINEKEKFNALEVGFHETYSTTDFSFELATLQLFTFSISRLIFRVIFVRFN